MFHDDEMVLGKWMASLGRILLYVLSRCCCPPPFRYHNQNQNRVAVAAAIMEARLSHRPREQLLQEHGRREQDGVQLPRAVQAQRSFGRRVRAEVRALLVRVRVLPVHTGRS
jgi:hypothetical protein